MMEAMLNWASKRRAQRANSMPAGRKSLVMSSTAWSSRPSAATIARGEAPDYRLRSLPDLPLNGAHCVVISFFAVALLMRTVVQPARERHCGA
jgi:hypothetical protein